jgi:hypothetical protein
MAARRGRLETQLQLLGRNNQIVLVLLLLLLGDGEGVLVLGGGLLAGQLDRLRAPVGRVGARLLERLRATLLRLAGGLAVVEKLGLAVLRLLLRLLTLLRDRLAKV